MIFDILALIVAVVLTGLGYHLGVLTRIYRLVGVIAAFFAAPTVAGVYKEILFARADLQQPILEWGMLALAGVSVYVVISIIGYLTVKLMRLSSEELSRKDKLLGGLLGAIKGVAVVYLVASSVLLIEAPLEKADPQDVLHIQKSAVVDTVRDYQVLIPWVMPELTKLRALLDDALDGELDDRREDAATSSLLSNDDVKALLDDPDIRQAARDNNISKLLASPEVRELLTHVDVLEQLRAAD